MPDAAALEEYRAAIGDMTRLNRLFAILSDPAPVAVVVDRIVIALSEMFAADLVALIQPSGLGELRTIGAIGLPEEMMSRPFSGGTGCCAAAAIESRAPVLVADTTQKPGMDPIFAELEVLGVLVVGRGQPLPFSRADTDLMMTMMHRMGLVLERARAEEERVHLESRLRQAEKAESLGRMAGAIAHQLNNKLTAVMGFLELALGEMAAGRDARTDVGYAQDAARDASRVGFQMLAYLGQSLRGREELDLAALCRGWIPELESGLRAGIRLRPELPERAMTMMGSPTDIHQLLVNLVANAEESIASGGEIVISLREVPASEIVPSPLLHSSWMPVAGKYARLAVSDDGSGMAAEVLRNAFDPFFTTKFTGRGLGLPVVLGVVRAHDGTLSVASTPGAGSEVSVYIPLAPV
jgi:signal transduction histidine kinase